MSDSSRNESYTKFIAALNDSFSALSSKTVARFLAPYEKREYACIIIYSPDLLQKPARDIGGAAVVLDVPVLILRQVTINIRNTESHEMGSQPADRVFGDVGD